MALRAQYVLCYQCMPAQREGFPYCLKHAQNFCKVVIEVYYCGGRIYGSCMLHGGALWQQICGAPCILCMGHHNAQSTVLSHCFGCNHKDLTKQQ